MPQQNATDETEVKKAQDRQYRMQEHLRRYYREVLSSRAGRAVLWHILEQAGIYIQSFEPNHSQTCFNEGQRRMGLWLRSNILQVDEKAYIVMQQEVIEEGKKDE